MIGDSAFLRSLDARDFTDDRFGVPTVNDIIAELEKPGRDPRGAFKAATFKEGVEELKDLLPGMILEGVVTNVTNFGAFVDIGVHQDGLVHISVLSDKFVKDPHAVVKAGDVVTVKVLEVDLARQRIALSMRLDEQRPDPSRRGTGEERNETGAPRPRVSARKPPPERPKAPPPAAPTGALAEAFARAKKRE